MASTKGSVVGSSEWQALADHQAKLADVHLRTLFDDDPERGEKLTAEGGDLFLDYSKNRLTGETISLLVALAEKAGLRERIEAMFSGEKINITEHRSVLHTALGRQA
jgi:glucose-6-phosphate isomerase